MLGCSDVAAERAAPRVVLVSTSCVACWRQLHVRRPSASLACRDPAPTALSRLLSPTSALSLTSETLPVSSQIDGSERTGILLQTRGPGMHDHEDVKLFLKLFVGSGVAPDPSLIRPRDPV